MAQCPEDDGWMMGLLTPSPPPARERGGGGWREVAVLDQIALKKVGYRT
jgi:hypothetical protein